MKRSHGHTGKSRKERSVYVDYIKKQNYEPTHDESLDFDESSDKDIDYSVPRSSNRRPKSIGLSIQEHFEDNWTNWLVGGFTLLLLFLMVDSKVDIARIFEKVNAMSNTINGIESNQKSEQEYRHNQDLKIQENRLRLNQVEKELTRSQSNDRNKEKEEKTAPNKTYKQ